MNDVSGDPQMLNWVQLRSNESQTQGRDGGKKKMGESKETYIQRDRQTDRDKKRKRESD